MPFWIWPQKTEVFLGAKMPFMGLSNGYAVAGINELLRQSWRKWIRKYPILSGDYLPSQRHL
jgi:hypothetical protein